MEGRKTVTLSHHTELSINLKGRKQSLVTSDRNYLEKKPEPTSVTVVILGMRLK